MFTLNWNLLWHYLRSIHFTSKKREWLHNKFTIMQRNLTQYTVSYVKEVKVVIHSAPRLIVTSHWLKLIILSDHAELLVLLYLFYSKFIKENKILPFDSIIARIYSVLCSFDVTRQLSRSNRNSEGRITRIDFTQYSRQT